MVMSDLTDLTERLEELRDRQWQHDNYLSPVDADLMDDAITALSPVLPDDVYKHIHNLRATLGMEKTADLLERQQREIKVYENKWIWAELAHKSKEELEQRIEQLTEEMEGWKAHVELGDEKIKELQARLDFIGNPQNGMVDLAAYARGE